MYDGKLVEEVQNRFLVQFIFHVKMEEEKGFGTFEETEGFLNSFYARGGNLQRLLSINEQETVNLRKAYEHLLEKINREEEASDYGLIESSLLRETHRILMEDIDLSNGKTKPGEFSSAPRCVEFNGELYSYPHYPKPGDMENAVYKLNYLTSIMTCLIFAPEMGLRTLMTCTIYLKPVRGCCLNFLIFTHLGMVTGDFVEFFAAMHYPS